MKTILYISIFVLSTITGFSKSNDDKNIKQNYMLGEKLINESDYRSALVYFLELDAISSNANISYHIGLCYLNSESSSDQEKAEDFFESAIEDISTSYISSYKETKAPAKSLYFLSMSYVKSYSFDKALKSITQYLSLIPAENKPEIEVATSQLSLIQKAKKNFTFAASASYNVKRLNRKTIHNNKKMVCYPHNIIYVNDSTNTMLFFTNSNELFKMNYKTFSVEPVDLTKCPISITFNCCISNPETKNICMLKSDGKIISNEKIEGNVNSKADEQGACLSKDGKTLYFSSNRKGGCGGYDIYKCELTTKGTWSKPQNLGPTVNTSSDEVTPYVLADGVTLYFSSNGTKSIGGFDVLTSTISEDGFWSESENLGFPLNTVNDEKSFVISEDEERAYFLSSKQNVNFDIYTVNLNEKIKANIF